jgi:hypothetical protein
MRTFVLVLLATVGCSDRDESSAPQPAPAPVVAAPVEEPVAPEPQGPQPIVQRLSIATFRNDQLDECTDLVGTISVPTPTPDPWPPNPVPDIFAALEIDQHSNRIRRPCAEQFADRTALGRCSIVNERPAEHLTTAVEGYYYRPETVFESDRFMRDCLRANGDWSTIDRNSDEAQAVVREQRRTDLQRSVRDLQAEAERLQHR